MGRKSLYFDLVEPKLHLVESWRKKGVSRDQIAKNLGIGITTLKEYEKKYESFKTALKNGKEVLVSDLENSLYKRAKGYDYEEVHTEIEETPIGRKVKKKIIKKHMPADVGAIIFSLTNLDKENWKNQKYVNAEDTENNIKDDGLSKQLEKVANSDIWEGLEDESED